MECKSYIYLLKNRTMMKVTENESYNLANTQFFALGSVLFEIKKIEVEGKAEEDEEEKQVQGEEKKQVKGKDSKEEEKKKLINHPITKMVSALQCKICYENEANTLFLPCKHNIVCQKCANDLALCPICQATIEQSILIYR